MKNIALAILAVGMAYLACKEKDGLCALISVIASIGVLVV